jgi:hypothetical protein
METNELAWNLEGNIFCVATGAGTVEMSTFPGEERKKSLQAHPSAVFCVKFDPTGK